MAAGRPKKFDREEVLHRAMELFWHRGYEASSLPELTQAMGISRQSLYDTFGSKRGLYLSAIEHYRETQLSQALAMLERSGSALQNVRDVMLFFEQLAADARGRGCFVANALVETGPHDPEIGALLHETLELLREGIERALRRAQSQGEIAPAKDAARLSRALTNAMIGLAVTGRLEQGRGHLHEVYQGTLSLLE